MTIKLHTLKYYGWNELKRALDAKLGKDVRDYAGKFTHNGTYDENAPYQDFWHWWMDTVCYGEVSNGAYLNTNLAYICEYNDLEPWVQEIMDAVREILGEKEWNSDITFLYCW